MRKLLIWLGCLILLVSFGLRLRDQARVEFWTDEAVSLRHARTTNWPALVESLARNEGMPPLYFFGLQVWRQGLGESELALRFPSIGLGVIGVALMAALAQRAFRRDAGLLGAAIMAVSPIHITLSQWARPYALALCITLCLLLLALELGKRSSLRAWVLFCLMAIAAMYTLYILGALLVGVGLYIAYQRRRRGLWDGLGPTVVAGLVTLIAFAPWLPVVLHQNTWAPQALWWVPPPQPRLALETLDQFLLGAEQRGWPVPLVLVFIPSIVALLLLGAYRAWKAGRLSFVLLSTGLPVLMIWIVSYWSPIYLPRHVAFALPGVVLLLMEAALSFRPILRSAMIATLVGAALVAQAMPLADQGNVIPWARVAQWTASQVRPGDVVVFSPPFSQAAFEIKYNGPPVEEYGIGEYETYARRPDAVFGVHIPLETIREWVRNRTEFWLLEDARWPNDWGDWEFQGTLRAEFPGLRIYQYSRRQ